MTTAHTRAPRDTRKNPRTTSSHSSSSFAFAFAFAFAHHRASPTVARRPQRRARRSRRRPMLSDRPTEGCCPTDRPMLSDRPTDAVRPTDQCCPTDRPTEGNHRRLARPSTDRRQNEAREERGETTKREKVRGEDDRTDRHGIARRRRRERGERKQSRRTDGVHELQRERVSKLRGVREWGERGEWSERAVREVCERARERAVRGVWKGKREFGGVRERRGRDAAVGGARRGPETDLSTNDRGASSDEE